MLAVSLALGMGIIDDFSAARAVLMNETVRWIQALCQRANAMFQVACTVPTSGALHLVCTTEARAVQVRPQPLASLVFELEDAAAFPMMLF